MSQPRLRKHAMRQRGEDTGETLRGAGLAGVGGVASRWHRRG
jgi:hypothetical protein